MLMRYSHSNYDEHDTVQSRRARKPNHKYFEQFVSVSNQSTKCDQNVNISDMDKARLSFQCYQDNSTVPAKHQSNTLPTASIRDFAACGILTTDSVSSNHDRLDLSSV